MPKYSFLLTMKGSFRYIWGGSYFLPVLGYKNKKGVYVMRQKIKIPCILLIFFVGILLPGISVLADGNAHALIISRGDYGDREIDLSPGPENDGENFRRILQRAYGGGLAVTTLKKSGAECVQDVQSAIQAAFADSDEGDVNYFFYSGHGGESGMWLGKNEFLSASDLAQAFSGIRGTNFLVIDCCYSGNLITGRALRNETFSKRFIDEFTGVVKGWKRRSALTNDNFHVMVAASEGQESIQTGLGEYGEEMGFFTSAAAAGCGVDFTKVSSKSGYECTAMADENRDGSISFSELYRYVSSSVYASDAGIYPAQDDTPFLAIDADSIPDTVITDVGLGRDEEGQIFLETGYQSGGDGILQGALYKCRTEEELWAALSMSVSGDVGAYPYASFVQAGSWEFEASAGSARAALPLGAEMLTRGEYLFLVNEKDGNTGCYTAVLELEANAEPQLLETFTVQAPDVFSIEKDGTLEITADFGSSLYANRYPCDVTCTIWNVRGKQVYSYTVQEIGIERAEGGWKRNSKFCWDGRRMNGAQAAEGKYTVEIEVRSFGGSVLQRSRTIQVESSVKSDLDSIAGMNAVLSAEQYVYDGMAKCPQVTVPGLINGKDFTVLYENNRNAGHATVRVVGTGDYAGTIIRNFKILPGHITSLEISVQKKLSYTGRPLKASVKLMYNDFVLKNGRDYILSYRDNKKPGRGRVTIQGIGNYTGKVVKSFRILPQTPKKFKVRKAGASVWKLSWKKASFAGGYEIQYSTNKKFKKLVKRAAVAKRNRITIRVPYENKKYYFRIRSYVKVNGKKWYSKFT